MHTPPSHRPAVARRDVMSAERPREMLPGGSGYFPSIVAQLSGQCSLAWRPPAGSACPGRTVQDISGLPGNQTELSRGSL